MGIFFSKKHDNEKTIYDTLQESLMSLKEEEKRLKVELEKSKKAVAEHSEQGYGAKYLIDKETSTSSTLPDGSIVTLYQIVATNDIRRWGVTAGQRGGWVEDHSVLSQTGDAWIADDAKVHWGIHVSGNAIVKDRATVMRKPQDGGWHCYVKDNAEISGDAIVISCEEVMGNAKISGFAHVSFSKLQGDTSISGKAIILHSSIRGKAAIKGNATVEYSFIEGKCLIEGDAKVLRKCSLSGYNHLFGSAVVGPNLSIQDRVIGGASTQPLKYRIDYSVTTSYKVVGYHGEVTLYRIFAVRDIMEWGVKSGDRGGWVESADSLSHDGNAWIAGEAKVLAGAFIKADALVKDEAVVIGHRGKSTIRCVVTNNAQISGKAKVSVCEKVTDNARIGGEAVVDNSHVLNNAVIEGRAQVFDSIVKDMAVVYDTATVNGSTISDNSSVGGYSLIRERSILKGGNYITGQAVIGPGDTVKNKRINGKDVREFVSANDKYQDSSLSIEDHKWNAAVDATIQRISEKHGIGRLSDLVEKSPKPVKTVVNNELLVKAVNDIEQEYNSYSHDIVKLIKYPLMTDPTFEPVGKFLQKLRKAKRCIDPLSTVALTEEMVDDLETAYLAMEASCRKESTRSLDRADKKKLKTAETMVQLALDSSSSENEKAMSAKKALDYLDGVVLLPEQAVESFRIKAGLKELTAG